MRISEIFFFVVLVAAVAALPQLIHLAYADPATSTNFILERGVIDSGGIEDASSTNFKGKGAIGQPGTGISTSTSFTLRGGFLYFSSLPPQVTSVTLNGGGSIALTPNATTAISVSAQVYDQDGCDDILSAGSTTLLVYRSGITSSTCSTTANSLNCYQGTLSVNSCTAGSLSANATGTVNIYYFAQPTDASSSWSGETWVATVIARDSSNQTASRDSSGVELLTLLAVVNTTSSINYGTLAASSTSGATNQTVTTTNAGNTTTTLALSSQITLVSSGNTIADSNQRFSTSTFTYPGTSTALTASSSPTTVGGFQLVAPTSTNAVAQPTFWGIQVPAATPTGTYSGVDNFQSVYVP